MPHTAPLCCKKQQRQKTPRAQRYTSSLLIPCAHGRLNVKHHRTTAKPEVQITVVEKEAALARKESTKTYTSGTATATVRIRMYTSEADLHKHGIMEEACEYGLTRGTCFVARRPEVVAVAGLLCISWCVLGAAGLLCVLFCFFIFFFLRTHTACCKCEDALPHLPIS